MVHPPVTKPVTPLWDSLGGARFALAMVVVAEHMRIDGVANPWIGAIASCSPYVAILSFLIISGFSIAHSISKQRTGFYRRRLVRIYPLYFLAIVLPMAFNTTGHPVTSRDVVPTLENLAFLQSFITLQTRFNPVTWTLGVEAACYLLAPWLARRRSWVLLLLAAASAGAFVVAGFNQVLYPSYMSAGEPLLVTAWAWISGFVYYRYHRQWWSAFVLGGTFTGVLLLSGLPFGHLFLVPCGLIVTVFAFGRFLHVPRPIRACLSFSGDVSYPLYLFHLPTLTILIHRLDIRSNFALIVGTVVVATLFTLLDIGLKQWRQWTVAKRVAVNTAPDQVEASRSPITY